MEQSSTYISFWPDLSSGSEFFLGTNHFEHNWIGGFGRSNTSYADHFT
jgi:hypothetical protein